LPSFNVIYEYKVDYPFGILSLWPSLMLLQTGIIKSKLIKKKHLGESAFFIEAIKGGILQLYCDINS